MGACKGRQNMILLALHGNLPSFLFKEVMDNACVQSRSESKRGLSHTIHKAQSDYTHTSSLSPLWYVCMYVRTIKATTYVYAH